MISRLIFIAVFLVTSKFAVAQSLVPVPLKGEYLFTGNTQIFETVETVEVSRRSPRWIGRNDLSNQEIMKIRDDLLKLNFNCQSTGNIYSPHFNCVRDLDPKDPQFTRETDIVKITFSNGIMGPLPLNGEGSVYADQTIEIAIKNGAERAGPKNPKYIFKPGQPTAVSVDYRGRSQNLVYATFTDPDTIYYQSNRGGYSKQMIDAPYDSVISYRVEIQLKKLIN